MTSLSARFKTGLWYENPGLVQLLGLCPLLAVTTTTVNGLGLGLSLIHISEPTRPILVSRMPSSA